MGAKNCGRWLPDGVEPWEIPLLDLDEVESVEELRTDAPALLEAWEAGGPAAGVAGSLW